jgi:phage baseplate assembly protein W
MHLVCSELLGGHRVDRPISFIFRVSSKRQDEHIRGQIEHVPTGTTAYFRNVSQAVAFIRSHLGVPSEPNVIVGKTMQPMLNALELPQVQEITITHQQVLAEQEPPGETDNWLQDPRRRQAQFVLRGVLTGQQAGKELTTLWEKYRNAKPIPFVVDITTATEIIQVLVEGMVVRELADKPGCFEYTLTLRAFTPGEIEGPLLGIEAPKALSKQKQRHPEIPDEIASLGTDLCLLRDLKSQNNRNRGSDLSTITRPESGEVDLKTLSGDENLQQALLLRFLTPNGELAGLGHPSYGSRLFELKGAPNTDATRNRAKFYVLQALTDEPRVEEVSEVRVTKNPAQPDRIDIMVSLRPVGRDTPLILAFQFFLDGGVTP